MIILKRKNVYVHISAAFILLLLSSLTCRADVPSPSASSDPIKLMPLGPIPAGAQFDANGHLDVERATRAYLDTIPADKRAASNKYFEGKYWLTLWDTLFTVVVMLALMFSGLSVRMRNFAARLTRFQWLQAWIYFIQFTIVTTLVGFPLNYYEGFYREHLYNQSHEALSVWLRDLMVGSLVGVIIGGIVVATLYTIVRKLPNSWHIWGSIVTIGFMVILLLISPVYLEPLFNTYTPLNDPEVTVPILKMARANGIAVDRLYEVNASKQTTNVSANVSGIFGSAQIRLNDNLLHQASLEEIEDVTGHEMGHYVLNHIEKMLSDLAILVFVIFAVLRFWLLSMQRRRGARWGTTGIADIAMLPAVVMAFSVLGLVLSPITNTLTRTQEYEADMYGLNAARQPDGSAQIDLKLGQYRKLEPGPVEEFLFFDHPSGYVRIRAAMRWKSENARTLKNAAGY